MIDNRMDKRSQDDLDLGVDNRPGDDPRTIDRGARQDGETIGGHRRSGKVGRQWGTTEIGEEDLETRRGGRPRWETNHLCSCVVVCHFHLPLHKLIELA
jgi:hypothetical protein